MNLSLRFWALCQFLYCCGLLYIDIIRSLLVFSGKRKWRRLRYTFDDLRIVLLEDVVRTAVRGHLNQMPFTCLEDDFPALGDRSWAMTTDRLVSFADKHLKRMEQGSVKKTGMLRGYAAAQRQHLRGCERCRAFICGAIAGDVVETRNIRAILKNAKVNHRD